MYTPQILPALQEVSANTHCTRKLLEVAGAAHDNK